MLAEVIFRTQGSRSKVNQQRPSERNVSQKKGQQRKEKPENPDIDQTEWHLDSVSLGAQNPPSPPNPPYCASSSEEALAKVLMHRTRNTLVPTGFDMFLSWLLEVAWPF